MKRIIYRILIGIAIVMSNIAYIHAQTTGDIKIEDINNFDASNATNSINDLKGSINQITKELFELDEKQKTEEGVSDQYKETRNEIINVINSINTTTQNVTKLIQKIGGYKEEIIKISEEIKNSRIGTEDTKEQIKNFVNMVYKLDNKLYDQEGNSIDTIKLLINSDNIPRTLANDYAIESTITQLNNLIISFDETEKNQIESITYLNKLKKQAQLDLQQYELDLEELQQKKNYLIQFLNLYKSDITKRKLKIEQLFESTKSVHEKMESILKEVRKGTYKVNFDMEAKLKELEKLEKTEYTYQLSWPIYPIYNVETYFGDLEFQKANGFPHLGIQIKAEQGTPIYAARDGVVYFIADNQEIGINRAMIVHTDGYSTIYEYLNKTIVKQGDIVRRGQLIGYSGGEPGTKGAGFISKGPNLTFMIFKNGVPLDPFDILDASIVQDKSVLPEGYQIKYLRDKYGRSIDITELKIMEGETLDERTYQFLKLYGVGIYKHLQFREDAVKNTNIDRDVVICIAFAESTLGKYLSTSNNIGNVGNNDRGDRVPMQSAFGGARAIALTLNNQHLGHYHTINQLSRYGNPDGKIYASSPINRQTNVLKCLSQIKGYYIPEDFPFRTGPNPNLALEQEHENLIQILKAKNNTK